MKHIDSKLLEFSLELRKKSAKTLNFRPMRGFHKTLNFTSTGVFDLSYFLLRLISVLLYNFDFKIAKNIIQICHLRCPGKILH